MAPAASTRWSPTPEQLMILEEMYRGGVRTPNATQIQQITTHLSFYGKIEGKNVFYWFQNHKARERQKLRRKLSKQLQQQQQQLFHRHQMQQNNHLVHFFDSSVSPGLSFYSPNTGFLPQLVGILDQDGQTKVMNYTWNKVDVPEKGGMMDKSMMSMYGSDWLMMMDVSPPLSPCCKRPPPKTLELFPVSASNLKEECKLQEAPTQQNPCSV
ncbi:hypothetical protein SLEP1_g19879 [Rubroshorea leprosula]|uniref:Homeobox domain-containing protein n=1 Tax=Rubroshorea leprosula TaxID=152421 RepID=A0AAV5J0S4_9ROSI|nr:hypothetical protein SLEP1_g19879 [Rubroshorea leprosula]